MTERQVTNWCRSCVTRQETITELENHITGMEQRAAEQCDRIKELEVELAGAGVAIQLWEKTHAEQVFELGVLREQVRVKSARNAELERDNGELMEQLAGRIVKVSELMEVVARSTDTILVLEASIRDLQGAKLQ